MPHGGPTATLPHAAHPGQLDLHLVGDRPDAWSTALLRCLVDDTPVNAEVVSEWIGKWSPLASRALEAFAGTLAEAPVPLDANEVTARITSDVARDTDSVLKAPPASTVPDTGRAGTDG
jgi:hypothetical protein